MLNITIRYLSDLSVKDKQDLLALIDMTDPYYNGPLLPGNVNYIREGYHLITYLDHNKGKVVANILDSMVFENENQWSHNGYDLSDTPQPIELTIQTMES